MQLFTHYVNLLTKTIYPAEILIDAGKILAIHPTDQSVSGYMLPGFVDAHIHIESSMLTPQQFAMMAVRHGTVATVSDPHEIANVCGIEGIEFMLASAKKSAFHFFFGAPSCVPATEFEHSGAVIDADSVRKLLDRHDIHYLSEMMNFPGVIHGDHEVLRKLEYGRQSGKPIDGHAPGLSGESLKIYRDQGITTDHECSCQDEAEEKIQLGMNIIIREGSAAKNFDALHPLIRLYPDQLMFCSDDKHPDDLLEGHIDQIVAKAVALGYDMYDVLRIACWNPRKHYHLPIGMGVVDHDANFIIVDDLITFKTNMTVLNGNVVYDAGEILMDYEKEEAINHFDLVDYDHSSIVLRSDKKSELVQVIGALDGELLTQHLVKELQVHNGEVQTDIQQDILKIVVLNRYKNNGQLAVGFIHGIGLQSGAIGSCVAHDSHNLVAVGVNDDAIHTVLQAMIENRGGIAAYDGISTHAMPLEVGGIMSLDSAENVGRHYAKIDQIAKSLGSSLNAPFMTLSFMSLPVIPDLKITDKGVFSMKYMDFINVLS